MNNHRRKLKGGEKTRHSNQAMKRPGTHTAFLARMLTGATTSAYPLQFFRGPSLTGIGGALEMIK